MVWLHPTMAKTVSSTTGALVGSGSLKAHSLYLKVTYLLRTDFYLQLQPLASIQ
jgi:hypothetical protein